MQTGLSVILLLLGNGDDGRCFEAGRYDALDERGVVDVLEHCWCD